MRWRSRVRYGARNLRHLPINDRLPLVYRDINELRDRYKKTSEAPKNSFLPSEDDNPQSAEEAAAVP